MSESIIFLMGMIIGIVAASILAVTTLEHGDDVRQEAIKAGVAEWTIDRLTGEKQFRWITPNNK